MRAAPSSPDPVSASPPVRPCVRLLSAIALAAWEAPQNVAGAALFAALMASGRVQRTTRREGRLSVRAAGLGVSLGWFIFWSPTPGTDPEWMWRHERGHGVQSRLLGPLYLPLVGLPSVSRVLYGIGYRAVRGRPWTRYYAGYPEAWADRAGGVHDRD